ILQGTPTIGHNIVGGISGQNTLTFILPGTTDPTALATFLTQAVPDGQTVSINGKTYTYQNIQTVIVQEMPAIISANSTTFTVGAAGSFTVTGVGIPTLTLSESGALPSGVHFDAATGILSGTPDAGTGGTYPITFTATNGILPDATQAFTLTVD